MGAVDCGVVAIIEILYSVGYQFGDVIGEALDRLRKRKPASEGDPHAAQSRGMVRRLLRRR